MTPEVKSHYVLKFSAILSRLGELNPDATTDESCYVDELAGFSFTFIEVKPERHRLPSSLYHTQHVKLFLGTLCADGEIPAGVYRIV